MDRVYSPKNLKFTKEKWQVYSINNSNYPNISKYFDLHILDMNTDVGKDEARKVGKLRRSLYEIDTLNLYFPAFCSYFEKGTNTK